MPVNPGDGEDYAARVARLLDATEAKLLTLLAQMLREDADRDDWREAKLRDLQRLLWEATKAGRAITPEVMQTIRDVILDAMNAGVATALNDLPRDTPVLTGRNVQRSTTLAASLEQQVRSAIDRMPILLGRAYQEAVHAGAAQVLGGKVTRLQASQSVLDRLLSQGVRGYTDRAGRQWSLDTFVEMSVRTVAGQAAITAHTDQLVHAGRDLVIVSDSPRECPLCLIPGTVVEGPMPTGGTRSEYTGNVIRIVTASGKDLTGTPDHPVLTPRGWVALKDLAEGDEVVSHDREQGFSGVVPDDVQMPARIEEAAEAGGPVLFAGPTRRDLDQHVAYREISGPALDLHLAAIRNAALVEPPTYGNFVGGVGASLGGLGLRCCELDGGVPDLAGVRSVHGVEHGGALLGAGLLPPPQHASRGHLGSLLVSERRHVLTDGVMPWAGLNSGPAQVIADHPTADAEGGAELLRALSGKVALDKIVRLSVSQFSGHVWDLTTAPSWFVANGIVTHNCRPWEGKVLSISGAVGAVIVPSRTTGDPVRVQVAGTVAQARAAGLMHPNCRHGLSSFIPGATTRRAPRQDPAAYEASQRQRAIERKLREWKRRNALALTDEQAAYASGKVREWSNALRDHVEEHDLKRLRSRERVGTPADPLAH